jgi:hypothetical protein
MVSTYPDMLTTWAHAAMLNKEPWRRDSDDHLCCLDDARSNNNRE